MGQILFVFKKLKCKDGFSVVRSFGVVKFLDWGSFTSQGAAGGVLVLWDRALVFLAGSLFSISSCFKICEYGFLVFMALSEEEVKSVPGQS